MLLYSAKPRIFPALLLLLALPLIIGGLWLAALGGSFYYVLAGVGAAASAVFLFRGRLIGVWIYGGVFVATLLWALWEVGTNGWALMPRLLLWSVLGGWLLTPWGRRGLR